MANIKTKRYKFLENEVMIKALGAAETTIPAGIHTVVFDDVVNAVDRQRGTECEIRHGKVATRVLRSDLEKLVEDGNVEEV